jgi:hypothetical protein
MTMFEIDVLFIILDRWNVSECSVGLDICDLHEVQTICGTLVSEDEKKLSIQFMKEL